MARRIDKTTKTHKRFCISEDQWDRARAARDVMRSRGAYVPEDDAEFCRMLLSEGLARILAQHGD